MQLAGTVRAKVAVAASALLALAGLTTITSGLAGAATISVPAKYKNGITVAMDASYPPDEFLKGSKIVGFDVDLGTALSKVMGVKFNLLNVPFDSILIGVEGGKYGIGNSSFTDTKEREGAVDFVDYFVAGEAFYEDSGSKETFNGLKSLCGHSVAVETGTTEQSDAEAQKKHCSVDVEPYENQNEANLAVSSHRADVGFADSQVAAYIVHLSQGQFKLTGKAFETAPYGFIVAKGSGLTQPLYQAFKTIMANGQYMKILDKWGVQAGALKAPKINGATS